MYSDHQASGAAFEQMLHHIAPASSEATPAHISAHSQRQLPSGRQALAIKRRTERQLKTAPVAVPVAQMAANDQEFNHSPFKAGRRPAQARPHTDEARAKISAAKLGRGYPSNRKDASQNKAQPVQIDGVVYRSMAAAGKAHELSPAAVRYRIQSPYYPSWVMAVND